MKVLFKLLHAESRYTSKPIVYLAHPTEFLESKVKTKKGLWKVHVMREHFTPSFICGHSLRLRNLLYSVDREALYRNTQELFAYMASFPDVTFMTVSEYAIRNLGEGS